MTPKASKLIPKGTKSAPTSESEGKKSASAVASTDKKKRRKKRHESFSIYIYKVLKQVHPDAAMSFKAMSIMNSFVQDMFQHIMTESAKLSTYGTTKTLTSLEIENAVRLLLPGEIGKHAVSEGTRATFFMRPKR